MDDINRKRLEWMATAQVGTPLPADLFDTDATGNGWGPAVSAAAKAAIDELDRLTDALEHERRSRTDSRNL